MFEQNGILRVLSPYYTNLNQRLIKTPKIYFEDTGLAVRLQGWSTYEPLLLSPYFGHLFENLVLAEITRFFINKGQIPEIYFIRSKEQVEIDFLLQLSNHRFIAIEVKTKAVDLTNQQMLLLESLEINIVDKWIVAPQRSHNFAFAKVVCIEQIYEQLEMHNPVGKGLDSPVPPCYRNRVNSLYFPSSGFPATGGPNLFTP